MVRPTHTLLTAARGAAKLESPDFGHGLIKKHIPKAISCSTGVVIDHGKGSYAYTVDGDRYLDMATNIGVLSTGHCHPRVVEALQRQASSLIMAGQNLFPSSRPMLDLYERFERIVPSHLSQYVLVSSGSEAVENAVKIARNATGRQNVIAFDGAFHGRTFGAMALTTSKAVYRQTYGPLMPGVHAARFPYWLHDPASLARLGAPVSPPRTPSAGELNLVRDGALESLRGMLQTHTHPSETAAIIIEPIQGEGGITAPPPGFLRGLRDIADEHGFMLIFDEVQAGMARTGHWWSHQALEEGVNPDIMTFAKGIASGVPFAGVAATPEATAKLQPGMIGGTYGGSALGCAAAAATIDVIEEEGLLANAEARGRQLVDGVRALADRFPIVDVRGRGLMIGVEFAGEHGVAARVAAAAVQRKVLLLTAGARDTVRFLPPLNVSEAEVDEALAVFEAALGDVFA